jgi:hypothetical protein
VDEAGASHPIIMGCYGIGIGRLMAAVIELNHDDKGIIWPKSVAPYQVYLCPLYMDNADVIKQADGLYKELTDMGVEVLYDDRAESPGGKFNDADLLGSSIIRVPDEPPESAWPAARAALDEKAGQECSQAGGAQHTRSLKLQVEYLDPHWTLLLLPMYASYYLDDEGRRRPVWIHGQTGQINGVRVASQSAGWKWAAVLGGIGLVLLILSLILGAVGVALLPLAPIAVLLAVLAFLFGIAAIVPAVWPWQWNQRHKPKS